MENKKYEYQRTTTDRKIDSHVMCQIHTGFKGIVSVGSLLKILQLRSTFIVTCTAILMVILTNIDSYLHR